MAKTELTPGYRFHPTGVELVVYFLKRKVMGQELRDGAIAELDIYKFAPWDLPEKSCLGTGELEWYFFCPRKKKYDNGNRIKRSTEIGYWKATGKDRVVRHNNNTVGMIKSLIFHIGKSSRGKRTDWVMHEYRLQDEDLADKGIAQDSYVVCKVFQKEGLGPRNGAQYGRQFNEEEWDNEELGIPYAASTAQVPILPVTSDGSVPNGNHLPASGCIGSASKLCLSGSIPSPGTANPSDSNVLLGNAVDNPDQENIAEGAPPSDDFFDGLEDYWVGFSSGQNTEFSTNGTATTGDVGSSNDLDFLELIDLDIPLF